MRRLSVASLDSGAESPVYGAEPSASADLYSTGTPRPAAWATRVVADAWLAEITSPLAPRGRATRDITTAVDLTIPGQVGTAAARLAASCDMSVVDQQSGRWYVKDIRASTQPMGTQ